MTNNNVDKSKMSIEEFESKFMSMSEFQKSLNLSTYQYGRQIVQTGRYNLETIEVMGRTYVSRESVKRAIETRKHNKETTN